MLPEGWLVRRTCGWWRSKAGQPPGSTSPTIPPLCVRFASVSPGRTGGLRSATGGCRARPRRLGPAPGLKAGLPSIPTRPIACGTSSSISEPPRLGRRASCLAAAGRRCHRRAGRPSRTRRLGAGGALGPPDPEPAFRVPLADSLSPRRGGGAAGNLPAARGAPRSLSSDSTGRSRGAGAAQICSKMPLRSQPCQWVVTPLVSNQWMLGDKVGLPGSPVSRQT